LPRGAGGAYRHFSATFVTPAEKKDFHRFNTYDIL
jgi:hypothetical protein